MLKAAHTSRAKMVRAALSRIHPHNLWRQGALFQQPDGAEDTPSMTQIAAAIAKITGLRFSKSHLSSIYKGRFEPSEEVYAAMRQVSGGACSIDEMKAWHKKTPPVWKRDAAVKKAVADHGRRRARLRAPRKDDPKFLN